MFCALLVYRGRSPAVGGRPWDKGMEQTVVDLPRTGHQAVDAGTPLLARVELYSLGGYSGKLLCRGVGTW